MRIIIEPDTEGENCKRKVFDKVTQCIVAGSLIRGEIAPATFREVYVGRGEATNEMIGVLYAAIESLRDYKRDGNGSDSTG